MHSLRRLHEYLPCLPSQRRYSYSATVPGPIGSVLSPANDPQRHHSLPYACTLCGSCTDVCPVKIPLHHQLLAWRGECRTEDDSMDQTHVHEGLVQHPGTALASSHGGFGGSHQFALVTQVTHAQLFNTWARQRDLPPAPAKSFREQYRQRNKVSS